MEQHSVRIMNGTYKVEETGVRVDLFGRAKSGQSLALRYRGFNPYFFVVNPDDSILVELKEDEEVIR